MRWLDHEQPTEVGGLIRLKCVVCDCECLSGIILYLIVRVF